MSKPYSSPGIINFQNPETLIGTVGGGNKNFTLPSQPSTNFVIVLGGLVLVPNVDYTFTGQNVSFTNAPATSPVAYLSS